MLLKTRTWILGFSLALALCAAPSVADATLLSGWFGPESAVYQPAYAASACNTCAPTYAYQPVAVASGCNTCTPTTAYYPTRTAYRRYLYRPTYAYRAYAYRPSYVYRRTYRPIFGGRGCNTCTPTYAAAPVVTSGCYTGGCSTGCYTGSCSTGGCSTGACGVPTITNYAPTATLTSGCCGVGTTVASPVTSYSSATTTATPTPATQAPATGTPQPDLKSTYQVAPEKKTFKKEPAAEEKKDDALQPIPQSTGKSSGTGTGIFSKPKIANPKDRTAKVFVPRYQVQQAVHVQPVAQPQRKLSADGWRAAK